MKTVLPRLLLPLALGACARDTTVYPSLERRAVESIDFSQPPAEREAVLTADPALDRTVAALRRDLARIVAGFDTAAARARDLVGAAGARRVGSEPWLDAQTALAALDDWRAQATELAGRADTAARERAAAIQPAYPALEAVQADIDREIARQEAAIDTLQRGIPAV